VTTLVLIGCYFARTKQEEYILDYRFINDEGDWKFLNYRNIVVVPIFQFLGMLLFGLTKFCEKPT